MDLGWLANVAKHLPKGLPSSQCLDPVDLSAGNLSVSAGRASGALEPLQNLASSAPDGFPVLRSGGSKRWKLSGPSSSQIDLREGLVKQN